MRSRILAAAILGLVAALPASAQAGQRVDYAHSFTTAVPGTSTGVDAQILYKHPTDPNAKPIPVRQEVFTFPEGTEFDSAAVPDCTASELELQLLGPSACPPESRLGGGFGDTFMTGFPGSGETAMQLDIFDDGSAFVAVGGPEGMPIRQATRASRSGRVITVPVPRMPGGPPDGEGALRRIHNVTEARTLGVHAYVRTPATCPDSGVWTFEGRFTFADGVVETATSTMPCGA